MESQIVFVLFWSFWAVKFTSHIVVVYGITVIDFSKWQQILVEKACEAITPYESIEHEI